MAVGPKPAHFRSLVLRQDLSKHTLDTELRGHGIRRTLVVARDHYNFEAQPLELRNRSDGCFFNRVRERHQSAERRIDSYEHGCLALALQAFRFGGERAQVDAPVRH